VFGCLDEMIADRHSPASRGGENKSHDRRGRG
jgi:hypothetical protein